MDISGAIFVRMVELPLAVLGLYVAVPDARLAFLVDGRAGGQKTRSDRLGKVEHRADGGLVNCSDLSVC